MFETGLFGKKSKVVDEKSSYYTSVATHRAQNVIHFKRGFKHFYYSNLVLLDCCMNLDVVSTILGLLVEMTNSSYTKDFARVSTLGEKMETGGKNKDGELATALFANPFGVYIDTNGHLFVLDGHSIRLVELNTEKKLVHTVAGNETQGTNDGKGEDARFMLPVFMSQDPSGDYLVLESHGHQIRKISFNQGLLGKEITPKSLECTVSTRFRFNRDDKDLSYPHWIGYDRNQKLICTDTVHNDVCILDLDRRKRKSLLKDSSIGFYYPAGCCFNSAGDLFVCDYHHHCIKKVPFSKKGEKQNDPVIFVGSNQLPGFVDGVGVNSMFWNPNGIALDVDDYLIVADAGNNAIRRISPTGAVTTIAGARTGIPTISGAHVDGKGTDARFSTPTNIVIDNHGNIIVADWKNSVLRMVQF
jgi:sugar lactone lactonase YvrE